MRPTFSLSAGVAAIATLLGMSGSGSNFSTVATRPRGANAELVEARRSSALLAAHKARNNLPHVGDKERAKTAYLPDGLLHKETPALRSNHNKRLGLAVSRKVAKARKKSAAPVSLAQ